MKEKCFVCGSEDYILPDNICESCAIENQRNVIIYQEMGMDFKQAQDKSITNMKSFYNTLDEIHSQTEVDTT